jgi:hypothetical protein
MTTVTVLPGPERRRRWTAAEFHFRHDAQHPQNHLAGGIGGVDGGLQDLECGFLLRELVNEVEHVVSGVAKPVQFHDNKRVPGLDEIQDRLQFGAAVTAFAAGLLLPDGVAQTAVSRSKRQLGR